MDRRVAGWSAGGHVDHLCGRQISPWPARKVTDYSWKLPAYSGAVLLTVDNFSFFLTVGAFLLTILAFLLTIGAFLLTVGRCV